MKYNTALPEITGHFSGNQFQFKKIKKNSQDSAPWRMATVRPPRISGERPQSTDGAVRGKDQPAYSRLAIGRVNIIEYGTHQTPKIHTRFSQAVSWLRGQKQRVLMAIYGQLWYTTDESFSGAL